MCNICVYGAASDAIDQSYIDNVYEMSLLLGQEGYDLIFGGGNTGLMGAAAKGFSKTNREVIGVFPEFMEEYEARYKACTTIHFTKTMSERKDYMEMHADAFVIVPGGVGTFDEFFQVLTLKELNQLGGDKPIILFNINGYYDKMREILESGFDQGFIRPEIRKMYEICDSKEEILLILNQHFK